MPYLYHAFTSGVGDSPNSALIRPSNWNARFQYSNAASTGPGGSDALVREQLGVDRNYYIRTDGSDSNTGLANTAGGAFLTIQHAYNIICQTLDLGGFTVTINIGTGSFLGCTQNTSWVGGGFIIFSGNGSANTTIDSDGVTSSIVNVATTLTGNLRVANMQINDTGGWNCLNLGGVCIVDCGADVKFGTSVAAHISTPAPGALFDNNNYGGTAYTINGNATYHFFALASGSRIRGGTSVTLTGTPAFAGAFAYATGLGQIRSTGTFTGSATGQRYLADTNGVIDANGNGVNYFPGDVAGATATGGQYV